MHSYFEIHFYLMTSFKDLGLSENILKGLDELGFENPTPIQEKSIPVLVKKASDFIGLAKTGTGKTAAFGIPLLENLEPQQGVQAVILAPTRELAQQICTELQNFAKHLPKVKILPVYGGTQITTQIRELKKGVDILVATPGRLIDLKDRRAVDFSSVEFVILDEADEMLNMGFKDDIDTILSTIPESRSMWMFSATMSKDIRRIVMQFMKDPYEVKLNSEFATNENIEHLYSVTGRKYRKQALARVIAAEVDLYGIVFCRTKVETNELAAELISDGIPAEALNGDLSQNQRDFVMGRFKSKQARLLIATDVAARGIDVNGLTHIFHFGLPEDIENYTHRSGRTARAGKKGKSVAFVDSSEKRRLFQLEKKLSVKFNEMVLPEKSAILNARIEIALNRYADQTIHLNSQNFVRAYEKFFDLTKEELIEKLVSLEEENALSLLNKINFDTPKFKDRDSNDGFSFNDGDFLPMRLSLGRVDRMNKGDILKFVCDSYGLSKKHLGRIDMFDTFSSVEVDTVKAEKIISDTDLEFFLNGRSVRFEKQLKPMRSRSNGRSRGGSRDSFGGGKRSGSGDFKGNRFSSDKGPKRNKPSKRRTAY